MTETDDHECEIIRALTGTTTVYCACGWTWSGFTPDTKHALKQVHHPHPHRTRPRPTKPIGSTT